MDVALQNAVARREALYERIDNIDSEIAALREARDRASVDLESTEAFVHMWYVMAGVPNPQQQLIEVDNEPTPPPRRPKNPDREFVADMALDLIRMENRPLSRREIFDALAAHGVAIHGKDPEMVLSTMLWRSQDKIVRLPQHGYWPKTEAYSDAAYFPGASGDIFDMAAKEPEDGVEADDAD
jgi:hypothetical protein